MADEAKFDEVIGNLNHRLTRDHVDFFVKSLYKTRNDAVFAQILAYKDARVDMDVLDEIIGPGYWQNEYKRDSNDFLQCGIGIWNWDLEQWLWKWSNGTPSQFEKEKGEYSDALKRAGYMWGIGRDLYNFPRITIQLNDTEYFIGDNGKPKASNSLKVNDWTWAIGVDYKKITAHQWIRNQKKVLRFDSNPYDSENPRT